MQPWGCIFQNGFLGQVQFKKSLKKWTFQQTKKWGFIQEKKPKHDFSHYRGSIQEWGCNLVDTVLNNVLNGAFQTMSWQNPQYLYFL